MKKLFVGNLSWKTTEDQLKAHFEKIGKVVSAKIVTDQMTGRSRGFGFVEMEDADAATVAIKELDNQPLNDRELRVSLALERPTKSGNQSSGPSSRDRGDRGDRGERSYGGGRGKSDSYGNRGSFGGSRNYANRGN